MYHMLTELNSFSRFAVDLYLGLNNGRKLGFIWQQTSLKYRTHKSRRLPAVPWLNIQRHFEQIVSKLLLTHVAHWVQVLEEPLRNKTKRQIISSGFKVDVERPKRTLEG